MATDPAGEIAELTAKLASVEAVLDPSAMSKEADGLRERAGDPGLWDDPEQGQAVTRRLSYLDGELSRLASLRQRLDDTMIMFELSDDENDEAARAEAETSAQFAEASPFPTVEDIQKDVYWEADNPADRKSQGTLFFS